MREFRLVVTGKAEVGAGSKKEFSRLCLLFMRLGMTGDTTACLDYGVEGLSLKFELMAYGTVRKLFGMPNLRRRKNNGKYEENNKKQTFFMLLAYFINAYFHPSTTIQKPSFQCQ
jgi:hypothetical protein